MRSSAVLLGLAALPASCAPGPRDAANELSCGATTEVGVLMVGEQRVFHVSWPNGSAETLRVERLWTECGLTATTDDGALLEPGESFGVFLVPDTSRPKKFRARALLDLADGQRVVLAELGFEVAPLLELVPERQSLDLQRGETRAEFRVRDGRLPASSVTEVRAEQPWIRATLVDEGQLPALQLEVDARAAWRGEFEIGCDLLGRARAANEVLAQARITLRNRPPGLSWAPTEIVLALLPGEGAPLDIEVYDGVTRLGLDTVRLQVASPLVVERTENGFALRAGSDLVSGVETALLVDTAAGTIRVPLLVACRRQ